MQIQINTDHSIEGHEALNAYVSSVVDDVLSQFRDHITRVEVHLADENGEAKNHKSGQNDKRCVMEARLEGHPPLAVTAHADTLHKAIGSAADKLARVIETTIGRQHDAKRRRNDEPTPLATTPADE